LQHVAVWGRDASIRFYHSFHEESQFMLLIFRRITAVVLFLPLLSFAQSAAPKSRAEQLIASMPHVKSIRQVAISPDGKRVAYVTRNQLYVVAADTQPSAMPTAISVPGNLSLGDPVWSSDSKKLAFVSDTPAEVPAGAVWVTDFAGAPEHLADFKGEVSTPSFSPDGKPLAVLFIEGIPRASGPLMPMTPPAGVIEEHFYEQRITTIDLATKAVKQVSPANMYVYEYDWTPDGKSWAAIAAEGSGDNKWWIARLYTVDVVSGELKEIHKPKLQIAEPKVSPDGKQVAFISGIMSDQGSTGGDVFVVPIGGGEAKNLTPGMKASASTITWTSPSQILFGENIDGNAGIASVSTSGELKQLWSGPEAISGSGYGFGFSVASDAKTFALTRQSYSTAPEVWVGPIGGFRQLTSLNSGVKPAWGEARNVHWDNAGTRIQGWLLFPLNYDASKKYPLVVTVHGGPSAACAARFNSNDGLLSAAGYFVLCPNPRGSYGQGEAFTQGNVKDFGGGDFRDIMSGIDALIKQFAIDGNRLGIRGHSYGGYMTMWAETQTTRFKAAVAGAGLSNWTSYYGQNDIDEWMIPFFGASVYDDPAVYAKSDPIRFVKNVKTPTLILVGDRDGEVPAPQSFEWWHALKTLGVPTQFVVYPNEGHAINKPEHQHDMQIRTLGWFDKYLAPAQPN
jgi:dipeptidyl aminopeptidase/acylaminoacyl peptidase